MDDLIVRISAIEHYSYCPRQQALIDVEGQWVDNRHTVRGARTHRRVDSAPSGRLGDRVVLRSIPLWSERHALSGRADVVEVLDGRLVPVEYKSSSRYSEAAEAQLCAQALCLEEMFGVDVPLGYVWYGSSRRRARVELDEQLRSRVVEMISAIRATLRSGELPTARADHRCEQCQFRPQCLPDLVVDPDRVLARARHILEGVP